jgi:hypothetical protein
MLCFNKIIYSNHVGDPLDEGLSIAIENLRQKEQQLPSELKKTEALKELRRTLRLMFNVSELDIYQAYDVV